MINHRLSWESHVNYIISRANRLLGLINSMSSGLTSSASFTLYKSLVLPILEYGLPAWMPYNRNLCDRLEGVQRRATRMILKQRRQQMPYPERLRTLNWSTLESRRTYLILSFIAKALYRFISCDDIVSTIKVVTRRPDDVRFKHLKARTQKLSKTVMHLFPILWDQLPTDLRTDFVLVNFPNWQQRLKSHVSSFD